jgi:hypothetical protein
MAAAAAAEAADIAASDPAAGIRTQLLVSMMKMREGGTPAAR